jgi:hypothetical protein
MASKRAAARSTSTGSAGGVSSPLITASLIAGAVGLGIWTLVVRGRLSWPPTELMANLFTVAGCLAVVGPIVLLSRREKGEGGLGELVWMAGGVIVWVFDIAAIAKGDWRGLAWTTPLGYQAMGLTILAVFISGWRWRSGSKDWSWTNVTGWLLGLFWVGMAVWTIVPTRNLVALAR